MKTKIICTLGPASSDQHTIEALIGAGMSVARLNFSHRKLNELAGTVRKIRLASKRANKKIIIMGDLQGPKIRIGYFKTAMINLSENHDFIFTPDKIIGNQHIVSVDYTDLYKYLLPKDRIFLDDGKIELEVKRVRTKQIQCRVIVGGPLSARKGLSVLNKQLPLPGITPQDAIDLKCGIQCGMDWFAHSFVRQACHVTELKELARSNGAKKLFVISKIEDSEGVENIDEIIKVSDGIMVARGDLGVSMDRALVPLLQKQITEKCNKAHRLDIVATQVMDSMISHPYPTRAEVNDVAVAVMQGSQYLMLSGETAVGKYPVKTTSEMARIIEVIEKNLKGINPHSRFNR